MEKKPTPGEPIPISTQKSLSSTHDPGWNDPPKWAYSHSPTLSTTPTKRLLNKRVAFPLDSTPPASTFDPNQPLTPPPANMPPPPLTAVRSSGTPHLPALAQPSEKFAKEKAMRDCLENFESVIDENEELAARREDIGRRLNLMKIAWTEEKLDDSICRNVLELSVALKKMDLDNADKIHVSLMLEHAALCSAWIPAIRHMILSMKEKEAQKKQNSEDNLNPFLLPCKDSSSKETTD